MKELRLEIEELEERIAPQLTPPVLAAISGGDSPGPGFGASVAGQVPVGEAASGVAGPPFAPPGPPS